MVRQQRDPNTGTDMLPSWYHGDMEPTLNDCYRSIPLYLPALRPQVAQANQGKTGAMPELQTAAMGYASKRIRVPQALPKGIYIGERFARWTVIGIMHNGDMWLAICSCECGTVRSVTISDIKNGKSKSCGCYSREISVAANRTHGLSDSPEYRAYACMITRCTNPNISEAHNYTGRGITVCDRWKNSFEAFYEDVGSRPSPRHSLDRIDNDGNYEPGNVRWSTPEEQCSNTRRNHWIEFGGKRKTLSQWSRELGINLSTLESRLRTGWPIKEALETPTMPPSDVWKRKRLERAELQRARRGQILVEIDNKPEAA